jgi:hypothetical protein
MLIVIARISIHPPYSVFEAKWAPVRVKKTRKTRNKSLGSDSIRTDQAEPFGTSQK